MIILLLIIIFIAIKCRKKKIINNDNEILIDHHQREFQNRENDTIKIIFSLNQERTVIFKHRQTSFRNLILSFKERKQIKNTQMLIFMLDGIKLNYNEAINNDRKLSEFIPEDITEKIILVYDWASFASESSQN